MNNNTDLLNIVMDNLKKLFYPEEWIELDMSLSKSELFVLLMLEQYNEIIMSQIANYINAPMSTATGVVDRLVKNGYIARERNEFDRRVVVIRLTDAGKEIVDRFKTVVFKYVAMLNDIMTEEERQVISKIFMKAIKLLDKDSQDPSREDADLNKIKKIDIE